MSTCMARCQFVSTSNCHLYKLLRQLMITRVPFMSFYFQAILQLQRLVRQKLWVSIWLSQYLSCTRSLSVINVNNISLSLCITSVLPSLTTVTWLIMPESLLTELHKRTLFTVFYSVRGVITACNLCVILSVTIR